MTHETHSTNPPPASFVVVMGVSGSGKTTVGRLLADRLGWDFYDADDFHPPANIAKMAAGVPLDDPDRLPWLAALHELIARSVAHQQPGVLACSALKDRYRQALQAGDGRVRLVYLKGDYALIEARMQARAGHYMKPEMLKSQFAALEEPPDALVVSVADSPEAIVETILEGLAAGYGGVSRPPETAG